MALSEHQLEDALEDARRQGLPHDWMLSLDVSATTVSSTSTASSTTAKGYASVLLVTFLDFSQIAFF